MKFICDKCRTKYSIADAKVRRKVLKIRCKNCANIVVVRDPNRPKTGEAQSVGGSSALDRALDGAFAGVTSGAPGSAGPGAGLAAVAQAPAPAQAFGPLEDRELSTMVGPSIEALREPPLPEEDDGENEWYLSVDGHQFGPMGFDELAKRVKRGEARGDEAHVWCDGFDDWLEVAKVPELRPYVPPPPPPGKSGLFPAAVMEPRLETPPGGVSGVGPAPAPPPPARRPGAPPLMTPVGVPVASPPPPAPPASTPAPPVSLAPPAPDLMPPVIESGLANLPAGFAGDAPEAQLPPALIPAAVPQGNQAWVKLAAISGIVTMLIGVLILVYVIFFDAERPHTAPATAPTGKAIATPEAPGTARPDGGTAVSLNFKQQDIRRTKERRVAGGRATRSKTPAAAVAPETKTPKLTAAEREKQRLLEVMKGGEGHAPTGVGKKTRRRVRPARQFSIREVDERRRKSAFMLKACYQRALKRDNSLKSIKAAIKIAIAPSGLIRRGGVKIGGVSDYSLRACLAKTVGRWSFKRIGGSQNTDVEFSLEFRGN